MKLTKVQNQELDNCKQHIEYIERNKENAYEKLEIARDIEDSKEVARLEKLYEDAKNEIASIIKMQAQSMKMDFDLMVDLIFDREYTIANL